MTVDVHFVHLDVFNLCSSLTQESKDFVLAMAAEKADRGLRIRLLRRACERHVKLYKDAMNGYGIDR